MSKGSLGKGNTNGLNDSEGFKLRIPVRKI